MSPPQATATWQGVCRLWKDKPQGDTRGIFPGPATKALTFHEDVLRQREAVVITELLALQVDQKGVPAERVDELIHLPTDGGREAVLVEVLVPAAHQAALLRVLDGRDGELQRELPSAHTALRLASSLLA